MKAFALLLSAALFAGASPTRASPPADGTSQVAQQAPAAEPAGDGRTLFISGTTPTCATCHALRDAGATGAIGPDLDALKPDAARVRNAVQKGFENMPAFGQVLSATQVDALARYVEQAAKAGK